MSPTRKRKAEEAEQRVERVRRIVIDAGMEGIKAVDGAGKLGVSYNSFRKAASVLMASGAIECTIANGGGTNRLGPPGIRAAYAAIYAARDKERRTYAPICRPDHAIGEAVKDIPALVRRVPVSVWALGDML